MLRIWGDLWPDEKKGLRELKPGDVLVWEFVFRQLHAGDPIDIDTWWSWINSPQPREPLPIAHAVGHAAGDVIWFKGHTKSSTEDWTAWQW